jgi:hypothetical protein
VGLAARADARCGTATQTCRGPSTAVSKAESHDRLTGPGALTGRTENRVCRIVNGLSGRRRKEDRHIIPARILVLLITGSLVWARAGPASSAASGPAEVEGTIRTINGMSMSITTADNRGVTSRMTTETYVLVPQAAALKSIRAGDFVGAAARREANGRLIATEIKIFPPAVRTRIPSGQWPMEWGQFMTNAVVTASSTRTGTHVLSLMYSGGTMLITVPQHARVERLVPIPRGSLAQGMHVIVWGAKQRSRTIIASVVIVAR